MANNYSINEDNTTSNPAENDNYQANNIPVNNTQIQSGHYSPMPTIEELTRQIQDMNQRIMTFMFHLVNLWMHFQLPIPVGLLSPSLFPGPVAMTQNGANSLIDNNGDCQGSRQQSTNTEVNPLSPPSSDAAQLSSDIGNPCRLNRERTDTKKAIDIDDQLPNLRSKVENVAESETNRLFTEIEQLLDHAVYDQPSSSSGTTHSAIAQTIVCDPKTSLNQPPSGTNTEFNAVQIDTTDAASTGNLKASNSGSSEQVAEIESNDGHLAPKHSTMTPVVKENITTTPVEGQHLVNGQSKVVDTVNLVPNGDVVKRTAVRQKYPSESINITSSRVIHVLPMVDKQEEDQRVSVSMTTTNSPETSASRSLTTKNINKTPTKLGKEQTTISSALIDNGSSRLRSVWGKLENHPTKSKKTDQQNSSTLDELNHVDLNIKSIPTTRDPGPPSTTSSAILALTELVTLGQLPDQRRVGSPPVAGTSILEVEMEDDQDILEISSSSPGRLKSPPSAKPVESEDAPPSNSGLRKGYRIPKLPENKKGNQEMQLPVEVSVKQIKWTANELEEHAKDICSGNSNNKKAGLPEKNGTAANRSTSRNHLLNCSPFYREVVQPQKKNSDVLEKGPTNVRCKICRRSYSPKSIKEHIKEIHYKYIERDNFSFSRAPPRHDQERPLTPTPIMIPATPPGADISTERSTTPALSTPSSSERPLTPTPRVEEPVEASQAFSRLKSSIGAVKLYNRKRSISGQDRSSKRVRHRSPNPIYNESVRKRGNREAHDDEKRRFSYYRNFDRYKVSPSKYYHRDSGRHQYHGKDRRDSYRGEYSGNLRMSHDDQKRPRRNRERSRSPYRQQLEQHRNSNTVRLSTKESEPRRHSPPSFFNWSIQSHSAIQPKQVPSYLSQWSCPVAGCKCGSFNFPPEKREVGISNKQDGVPLLPCMFPCEIRSNTATKNSRLSIQSSRKQETEIRRPAERQLQSQQFSPDGEFQVISEEKASSTGRLIMKISKKTLPKTHLENDSKQD